METMEERLKRSRDLLSNAFYATNSKLNRPHVSSRRELENTFMISQDDILNFSEPNPCSPDMTKSYPSNTHTKHQYSCDHVSSSPSPILLPTLASMSTFASFSYTSGYESSSSQHAIEATSLMPSTLGDCQDHSCSESETMLQQDERQMYPRLPEKELTHVHNDCGEKHIKSASKTQRKDI